MAVSEEQALKETFIQIHDFLLSQSCKKAAASLVKDAPAIAGLATRTPAPSTSKLVSLVKSDLERRSAATASSSVLKAPVKADSDSSSSEDSSSDDSSDSSSEDEGPAEKAVSAVKGKFAAVPPPSAVATSAVKAVTSTPKKAVQIVLPSSDSSSSSEDDSDSDSSDDEDEKKPPVKPAAVQPKAKVASSSSDSSSQESSSSDESSDEEEEVPKTTQTKVPVSKASTVKPAALAPAQADSSSDSSDSEDSSSDDEPTPAVKAVLATAAAQSAKATTAPSSSDSSESSSDESSSDDEAAPPAAKAKVAAQSSTKDGPAANGPFGGFVKAAQNAVQHAVEATLPHINGKPVAGQKRKASASSSSSSSDSSDSDSSSDEDAPPAKKTQTVQGGVTKATTTVQIPASAAASVQVSKKTEIVPEAESAVESGASTPMNADRAALINGPAVAAGLAKGKKGQNTPWRRVRAEEHTVDDRLKDNSFLGKGGSHNSDYGYKAAQDLIVTRGDSFRKEKNKKKRGSYRGGEISMQSYSIKFDD